MNKNELDYNRYDTLSLSLKTDALEKMLSFYSSFGWKEYERKEDSRYFDIVHIKLFREHNIKNKDKLQLLQIRMEAAVNKFAIARRDRHSHSVIFTLASLILAVLVATLAVVLSLKIKTVPVIVACAFFGASALAAPIALIPVIKRMWRRENENFMRAYREMGASISRIISATENLGGDSDE